MTDYIQYLTEKNILDLQFSILYEDRKEDKYTRLTGDDMTLKQLAILKNKIKNFNYNSETPTIDYIFETINKMVYVDKQYNNLLQEIRDELGSFNDFIKENVNDIFEEDNKKEKNRRISKFKSILEYNMTFIMNNKMRILERIEEVCKVKKEDKNEDLKAKIKEYNSRDDVKQKKKDYNNREDIKAKQKAYCNEKVGCECGFMTARKHLSRHKKTELHTKRLNSLSNNAVL